MVRDAVPSAGVSFVELVALSVAAAVAVVREGTAEGTST